MVGVAVQGNACAVSVGDSGFFPKAGYFALQIASLLTCPVDLVVMLKKWHKHIKGALRFKHFYVNLFFNKELIIVSGRLLLYLLVDRVP
jgi:hypothetical protein